MQNRWVGTQLHYSETEEPVYCYSTPNQCNNLIRSKKCWPNYHECCGCLEAESGLNDRSNVQTIEGQLISGRNWSEVVMLAN